MGIRSKYEKVSIPTKSKLMRLIEEGGREQVMKIYGISHSTVGNWCRKKGVKRVLMKDFDK